MLGGDGVLKGLADGASGRGDRGTDCWNDRKNICISLGFGANLRSHRDVLKI